MVRNDYYIGLHVDDSGNDIVKYRVLHDNMHVVWINGEYGVNYLFPDGNVSYTLWFKPLIIDFATECVDFYLSDEEYTKLYNFENACVTAEKSLEWARLIADCDFNALGESYVPTDR